MLRVFKRLVDIVCIAIARHEARLGETVELLCCRGAPRVACEMIIPDH